MLSALVGAVAGAGAIAFHYLCQTVLHLELGEITGYYPGSPEGDSGAKTRSP